MLEDAQFQPFAGIYRTYMLPNNHPDRAKRLERLIMAVKLVYASTYYESPEVLRQEHVSPHRGRKDGGGYPAPRGRGLRRPLLPHAGRRGPVLQLLPDRPYEAGGGHHPRRPGLGKMVVEGGTSLRFSPRYPQFMPQFSAVDDILKKLPTILLCAETQGFPG